MNETCSDIAHNSQQRVVSHNHNPATNSEAQYYAAIAAVTYVFFWWKSAQRKMAKNMVLVTKHASNNLHTHQNNMPQHGVVVKGLMWT
jgi:hypothetical protein